MKAIEQYFHVVLFIMLYKVVLKFQCDHSNESYRVVLSCGTVNMRYKVFLTLLVALLWKQVGSTCTFSTRMFIQFLLHCDFYPN